MATAPAYRVEGLNRFVSTMRRAGAEMNEFKDASAKTAGIVVAASQPRTPRRTGRLAGSIRAARQQKAVVVYAGSASIPYAGPIHWGWPSRRISAQPYILEGMRASEPVWQTAYAVELQKIVDGVRGAT